MIKSIPVVLDTNVLVSALWSANGIPAQILHLIPDGVITPIYCTEILGEYSTVLVRPSFKFLPNQVDELLQQFTKFGKHVSPERSNTLLPDESDRKFYDAARSENARLITGNLKHFPDETFVMSPAEFYQFILEGSME